GGEDRAEGPDQPGCVYRGTQVIEGVGQILVTEVGDATVLGQIAQQLSAEPADQEAGGSDSEQARIRRKLTISRELTPLQLKLKKLAEVISHVGYLAAGAIFLALLIRGVWVGEVRWQLHPGETASAALLVSSKALLNYFLY